MEVSGELFFSAVLDDGRELFKLFRVPAGDFDNNGILDAADMDLLSAEARRGGNSPEFDLNGDGLVDNQDRLVWVNEIRMTLWGDANLDFAIDAADVNAVALNWQQPLVSWAGGDFTGDGLVTSADLNALALNWRKIVNAPVPEPSSITLLSLALLATAR